MDKTMSLEKLKEAMDLGSQARHARYYHNAKRLIKVYRSIMWCLENDINDVELQSAEMGYEHIHQALELLACSMEDDAHIQRLQDKCKSMLFTRALILITDKALLALKSYPDDGEKYFEIINRSYILQSPYSENELLDTMQISRRTLYRTKKMAISLLGVILWGYMIPVLLSGHDVMELAPDWH